MSGRGLHLSEAEAIRLGIIPPPAPPPSARTGLSVGLRCFLCLAAGFMVGFFFGLMF